MQATVIIATYNRAELLTETLLDLARQRMMGDDEFEVIVADNASTDDTRKIVEDMIRSFPVSLRYLHEPAQGKSYALNHAIAQARGDVIVFTDDDTKLPANWVAQYLTSFRETEADGIGGPVRLLWLKPRPAWLTERLAKQMGVVDYRDERFTVEDKRYCFIGPNCAYRASLYRELGGYMPGESSEDVEFFLHAFRAGKKLVWEPAVAVGHKVQESQMTRDYLKRRFFRQGRGNASGSQENFKGPALCRIPLWVIKQYLLMPFQALGCLLRGDREEARWILLNRYLYAGFIYFCFQDWRHRRPLKRTRPEVFKSAGVRP